MVVKTQSKGRGVTALNIGLANVQRYFPHGTSSIDLEIDHLQIQCMLGPEFWDGQPEIFDPRLCAWLEQKQFHSKNRDPLSLTLTPSGKNSYRLRMTPAHAPAHAKVKLVPTAA